jgi:hypothetical protein
MADAFSVVVGKRPAKVFLDQIKSPQCTMLNKCRISNSSLSWHTVRIILLLLTIMSGRRTALARAQDDNTVCGCSPPTYTFLLDFNLFCPPIEIDRNPGIQSLSCLISPFGAPTTDLAPVVVTHVDVLELDQSNNVLEQSRIEGDFFSEDSFSYASILNNTAEIDDAEQIPRALQLILNARNEAGVTLINIFVITFSNQCGAVPVFETSTSEQSAGWAIFVSISFAGGGGTHMKCVRYPRSI